jgi:hypothetical protein
MGTPTFLHLAKRISFLHHYFQSFTSDFCERLAGSESIKDLLVHFSFILCLSLIPEVRILLHLIPPYQFHGPLNPEHLELH